MSESLSADEGFTQDGFTFDAGPTIVTAQLFAGYERVMALTRKLTP